MAALVFGINLIMLGAFILGVAALGFYAEGLRDREFGPVIFYAIAGLLLSGIGVWLFMS